MNLPVADKIIAMGKLFQFNEQEMIYLSMIKLAICRKFANLPFAENLQVKQRTGKH